MQAISIVPGSKQLALIDRPEPRITADDEVELRVIEVGICGTDREEAVGGRAGRQRASRTWSLATKCWAK